MQCMCKEASACSVEGFVALIGAKFQCIKTPRNRWLSSTIDKVRVAQKLRI